MDIPLDHGMDQNLDCNINIFDMKNKGWLSIEKSIMKFKHNSWSNIPKTSKMFLKS